MPHSCARWIAVVSIVFAALRQLLGVNMTRGHLRRPSLILGLCIACVCQRPANGQSAETPLSPALIAALRSGGLPAAAALVGHYKRVTDSFKTYPKDLQDMAPQSDLIVLARVVFLDPARLSEDASEISTDYDFTIEERFQGLTFSGDELRVRIPGGAVQFENGTIAEWWLRRLPPLQPGDELVLFLKAISGETGVFVPTTGYTSVFLFDSEGRVASPANTYNKVFRHAGLQRAAFLARVRTASAP